MLNQLFRILRGAGDTAEALSLSNAGDAAAGKNGMTGFVFKDNAGNLVHPTLNADGTISVSMDTGTPNGLAFTQAAGAQTKDVEVMVGEFTLALTKQYNCFYASINSTRLFFWRLVHIDDDAGTPTETVIAYGTTGEGSVSDEMKAAKRVIDTTGGTGVQKLRLYATPLDKEDDIYANVEYVELP